MKRVIFFIKNRLVQFFSLLQFHLSKLFVILLSFSLLLRYSALFRLLSFILAMNMCAMYERNITFTNTTFRESFSGAISLAFHNRAYIWMIEIFWISIVNVMKVWKIKILFVQSISKSLCTEIPGKQSSQRTRFFSSDANRTRTSDLSG